MAPAIGPSVAAQIQMNRVGNASTRVVPIDFDGVASFVRALENLEALPAILEHLRHKRQSVQLGILVERSQDLLLAADFDPIACA